MIVLVSNKAVKSLAVLPVKVPERVVINELKAFVETSLELEILTPVQASL